MNGKALYMFYKSNPPRRDQGSSHAQAYWDGYEGRPSKGVRTSYGWWAWKAGKEAARGAAKATKKPSYRIHKNVWDNWYGYEGTRRVEQFFNTPFASAEDNAKAWLKAKQEGK